MKNFLTSYSIVVNGDMSGTITSLVTCIKYQDNVCMQFNFTGTPTGNFYVDCSVDYATDYTGTVTNSGNWVPLTFQIPPIASGSPGNILLDMNQLSAPYIRMRYVPTSGSGTLNVFIGAKSV